MLDIDFFIAANDSQFSMYLQNSVLSLLTRSGVSLVKLELRVEKSCSELQSDRWAWESGDLRQIPEIHWKQLPGKALVGSVGVFGKIQ